MPKNELPLGAGPGVAPLEIAELDKAISRYQKKKDARCEASPDEIKTKKELKALLHKHRGELPLNSDGIPFYRCEDRDYLLDDKMVIRKVHDDEDEDEEG